MSITGDTINVPVLAAILLTQWIHTSLDDTPLDPDELASELSHIEEGVNPNGVWVGGKSFKVGRTDFDILLPKPQSREGNVLRKKAQAYLKKHADSCGVEDVTGVSGP